MENYEKVKIKGVLGAWCIANNFHPKEIALICSLSDFGPVKHDQDASVFTEGKNAYEA